jgi:GNAT superfamily N-acetyltransferase
VSATAGRKAAAEVQRQAPADVLVRRATIRDLTSVAALRLSLLREEADNALFARPHPDAARRALRLTRRQLATPGQVFLVATRNNEIVGVLRCRAVRRTPLVTGARQAVVTTAYVVPKARHSGVLLALVRAAERWCRQRRLSGMRLHCGLNNGVGQKAWQALGFRPAELLYLRGLPAD